MAPNGHVRTELSHQCANSKVADFTESGGRRSGGGVGGAGVVPEPTDGAPRRREPRGIDGR